MKLDMQVDGRLFRGVNLSGCFTYHTRTPPELLGALPTRIVVKPDKGGRLPDFGLGPWGGWKLVSQGFVDIVERLEPGIHEFLPIAETVDRKGQAIAKRYFLMNILQSFDAVDVQRSSVELHEFSYTLDIDSKEELFTGRTMGFVPPRILVLKRAVVAGHHLWHGTASDIYHVFFSEELHDAVQTAGLSPLQYFRAEEV